MFFIYKLFLKFFMKLSEILFFKIISKFIFFLCWVNLMKLCDINFSWFICMIIYVNVGE